MFGQPALVAAHGRRDAQREAFFAEQRVAAVAGAKRPDLAGFRKLHDVFGAAAWPCDVGLSGTQRCADAVHARHKRPIAAEHLEYSLAHAGHDAHVGHHIGRVGQLDADMSDRGAERTHRERHDVQGAATHATIEQAMQGGAHFGRGHPIIGRAGVFLPGGTDESAVFDARHVRRVGASQIAVRTLVVVQSGHGAACHHLGAQAIVFSFGAVTPVDAVRLGQGRDFGDPVDQLLLLNVRRDVQCCNATHDGLVHKTTSNANERNRSFPRHGRIVAS